MTEDHAGRPITFGRGLFIKSIMAGIAAQILQAVALGRGCGMIATTKAGWGRAMQP